MADMHTQLDEQPEATKPVTLCRHRGAAKIEIWAPRYHDRRVLINPLRVKEHNVIALTRANSLNGLYYLSGKTIRKYPKSSNGSIKCFAVKLDDLIPFEWEERCMHDY